MVKDVTNMFCNDITKQSNDLERLRILLFKSTRMNEMTEVMELENVY
jgi:hypothetical protein